MDRIQEFVARENIKRLSNILWTDIGQSQRLLSQVLLVEEENKLAKDLALLDDLDRCIQSGRQRIERQRELVFTMERNGSHAAATARTARALLDGMIESLRLHTEYRQRVLAEIEKNRL